MHPESQQKGRPRRRAGRRATLPLVALVLIATACGDSQAAGEGSAERGSAPAGSANVGSAPAGPVTVTDLSGRTIQLRRPARRVIALTPAINEWVIAMGATDRLVARTDYDDAPELAHLPSVGGGLDPSVEWLAAREPDLIVAWPDSPSRSLVDQLTALGIPVYTAPIQTVDEAFHVARDLGRLMGLPTRAATAISEVRSGLDSVRTAVAGRERPSVLFLIGLDPLMAAGAGTFADELIRRAGGRNAIGDLSVLWPHLSLEEVVRRAPDVVLVASAAVSDPATRLADEPGWRRVPAIRSGRVYALDPDRVTRPGPGLDETAARLAELLHHQP